MKKLTILVCVLLLLLSACTETVEPNTPSEPGAAPIESEPDITVSADLEELPDDPDLSPDNEKAWMDAYRDSILAAGSDTPRLITLADVTRDGIPELFFADLGTVNIWIASGLSYKNGQVSAVSLPDDWMPPSLELYRETETGEPVWIASQVARNGAGEYIHTWYICDFSDLSETRLMFLFGWVERTEDGNTWDYLLYGGDGTGHYEDAVKSSLEDVLTRQEQFFTAYDLLDTNTTYASLIDFITDYDGTSEELTAENLDNEQLMTYFTNWQSEKRNSPDNRAPYSTPAANLVAAELWTDAYAGVLLNNDVFNNF